MANVLNGNKEISSGTIEEENKKNVVIEFGMRI